MKLKIAFSFLLILLLVTFCFQKREIKEDNRILSKLLEEAIVNKQSTFTLSPVRPDWDSVIFLHPYSNIKTVGRSLKIDLGEITETGIDQRDDICVLVFVRNKKIAFYISFGREVFDFADLPANRFFTAKDKFQLIPDKSSKKARFLIKGEG